MSDTRQKESDPMSDPATLWDYSLAVGRLATFHHMVADAEAACEEMQARLLQAGVTKAEIGDAGLLAAQVADATRELVKHPTLEKGFGMVIEPRRAAGYTLILALNSANEEKVLATVRGSDDTAVLHAMQPYVLALSGAHIAVATQYASLHAKAVAKWGLRRVVPFLPR